RSETARGANHNDPVYRAAVAKRGVDGKCRCRLPASWHREVRRVLDPKRPFRRLGLMLQKPTFHLEGWPKLQGLSSLPPSPYVINKFSLVFVRADPSLKGAIKFHRITEPRERTCD